MTNAQMRTASGVLLVLAGMIGLYLDVDFSGWVLAAGIFIVL